MTETTQPTPAEIEAAMQEAERVAEERRRLETKAMEEHFRKHPHG